MSLIQIKGSSLMLKTFPCSWIPFVVALGQSPFLADLMPILLPSSQ